MWLLLENVFKKFFSGIIIMQINDIDIFNMIDFVSDFGYIAKYWNSDRMKLSWLCELLCDQKGVLTSYLFEYE